MAQIGPSHLDAAVNLADATGDPKGFEAARSAQSRSDFPNAKISKLVLKSDPMIDAEPNAIMNHPDLARFPNKPAQL